MAEEGDTAGELPDSNETSDHIKGRGISAKLLSVFQTASLPLCKRFSTSDFISVRTVCTGFNCKT